MLDPFHAHARAKRLRGKPLSDFSGDLFLRVLAAEREQLVTVSIEARARRAPGAFAQTGYLQCWGPCSRVKASSGQVSAPLIMKPWLMTREGLCARCGATCAQAGLPVSVCCTTSVQCVHDHHFVFPPYALIYRPLDKKQCCRDWA